MTDKIIKTKKDFKSSFTGNSNTDMIERLFEATIDLRNETVQVKLELEKLNNK